MKITERIIANADDFGMKQSVNAAVLRGFELGYINSASLMTNTIYFDETADLIGTHQSIKNLGLHINLLEGKPLSKFAATEYLDENGNWEKKKINNKYLLLNKVGKAAFFNEILTQIKKAIAAKIPVSHLDSHYHLHTLPAFFELFLQTAKLYKLKIRIAQSYNEGNYINYWYRLYINSVYKQNKLNYSEHFLTVDYLLNNPDIINSGAVIEVMLHPDLDSSGNLFDHVDQLPLLRWMQFVDNQ
jgi:predicted glycoside hydrolase/deacetylase ChbG (UPF0249 family)